MESKSIELTKDEAMSLSMAYRRTTREFGTMFREMFYSDTTNNMKNLLRELEDLQIKLEKFIDGFGE